MEATELMRPLDENALSHAVEECCESGSTSVSMYALAGSTKRDERDDSNEVHCFDASLSEQDFDNVGGASPRAGLRRTTPSCEKYARPGSSVWEDMESLAAGGTSQGDESFWAAIIISMLASPPLRSH